MRVCLFAGFVLACLQSASASAASFTANFESGLDGFTIQSFNAIGATISQPENFISVNETDGPSNFLEVTNETSFGVTPRVSIATRTIDIGATSSFLSLDVALLGVSGQNNGNDTLDALSIVLVERNDPGNIFDDEFTFLFDFEAGGPVNDPFGDAADAGVPVSTSPPSDPFFDVTFEADLSALIGRTLDLEVAIFNEPDGQNLTFGVDNVSLSSGATVVPLPAGLPLLAAALGAFAAFGGRPRRG
ncbi:MAG: hypothetical protein AAGE80_05140 [Pseudomonadota bacterium]